MKKTELNNIQRIQKDHALHAEIEAVQAQLKRIQGKSYQETHHEVIKRHNEKKHYEELVSKDTKQMDLNKVFIVAIIVIILISGINLLIAMTI